MNGLAPGSSSTPLRVVFPGQQPHERVFLIVRHHWMAFAPRILIIGFILAVIGAIWIFASIFSPEGIPAAGYPYMVVGTGITLLLTLAVFVFTWIDFYFDIVIITDERIVDIAQHGVFHRDVAELSLLRVQDVNAVVKGLFPTLFGYGKVMVETAGGHQHPMFVFDSIPKPNDIARVILELHERLVRQTAEQGQRDGLGEIVSPRVPEGMPGPVFTPPPTGSAPSGAPPPDAQPPSPTPPPPSSVVPPASSQGSRIGGPQRPWPDAVEPTSIPVERPASREVEKPALREAGPAPSTVEGPTDHQATPQNNQSVPFKEDAQ